MKVRLGRDGLHWMTMHKDGETLVIRHHRFPGWPKQAGLAVALTPKALAEDPAGLMWEAMVRLIRHAQNFDREVRRLDWRTLQFAIVKPDNGDLPSELLADGEPLTDHQNTVISWKANTR